jgi:transposase
MVSRDQLIGLYKELSQSAIAARYDVTEGAVSHKLRSYGITKEVVGRHQVGPKKQFDPPKEELERLYASMSMRKIAAHYGVGETVIFMRLKQHGIGGISRSQRLQEYKRTPEHQAAINKARPIQRGADNPNWKGGVSSEDRLGRSRKEYHAWKRAVIEKYDYKCVRCGIQQGYVCECCGAATLLHAHHIEPFSVAPDRRYDVSNGLALCNRCHFKEHHQQTG